MDASLRGLETGVRMECMDPSDLQLEVAAGGSTHPIRLELKPELRNEDMDWGRLSTWSLTARCDRHFHGHGFRMEFSVGQERRVLLRSPQVAMQSNVPIPGSLEPILQRALQGLDVVRSSFDY